MFLVHTYFPQKLLWIFGVYNFLYENFCFNLIGIMDFGGNIKSGNKTIDKKKKTKRSSNDQRQIPRLKFLPAGLACPTTTS